MVGPTFSKYSFILCTGVIFPRHWRTDIWCHCRTTINWIHNRRTWSFQACGIYAVPNKWVSCLIKHKLRAFQISNLFRQYIMEGLAAAFMFVLGGSGFIILDQTHATNMPKLNRTMLQFIGFGSLIIAFSCCWIFMKIKLPGYMNQWTNEP